ncbi:hypothetical protein [Streptomyces syringium]|uniref:hypothetical protein n=1 Tax=Streptomyces syringium TaxID=76729 RepID=UPI0033DC3BEA
MTDRETPDDRKALDLGIEELAEAARYRLRDEDYAAPHCADRIRMAALCVQAAAGFLTSVRAEQDPFGAPTLWEQLGEEYMRRAIQEYERQGRPA